MLNSDIQVETFVDSTTDGAGWHDITSRVRHTSGIEISHGGRGLGDGIPEPSECRMMWDCRDGFLWPGNPMSPVFGSLGLNTPLRVALRLINHSFPGSVVNGWSTVGGYPVVNDGNGGTVAASDFQQTPGVGTHSVPTTSAYRRSLLDGFDLEDCEQTIEFQLPTANVAGGAIEPANLIFRSTADDYLLLRTVVNTDETISMKWILVRVGIGEFDQTDVYTSTVTNTGQWLKVKANVEGNRYQAKIWNPGDLEPLEWLIDEAPNIFDTFLHPGEIGVRTGVASGNSNTKPIVVSYRNWVVRSLRFYGEISEYPLEADISGNDIKVPIVAAGLTRRLTQGTPPTLSALRRAIPQQPGLQAYWPLEDKRGSNEFGSALAGHPSMVPLTGTPGYAEFSDLPSSQALPTGNGSDWRGVVLDYDDTGTLQVSFVLHLPAGDQADRAILCRWYTDAPSAKLWQVVYRTGGGDLALQAWNSESAFVYESSTANFDLNGGTWLVSVQLTNNGSDVDWEMRALDMIAGGSGNLATGTATGLQLASCKLVWANLQLLDTPAFGHIVVQSIGTDFFALADESQAWDGEGSEGVRLVRLLNENGYQATRARGFAANEISMGPQEPATTPALLEECVKVGTGGKWFDGRTHAGVMYWHRTALYNQDPWISLSYAGRQLQPSWQPKIGDRDIRNRVTVSRKDGAEATYELPSGPKSVQSIPDGAGPYATSVTVNAENDAALQQMAAFRVALGTVDAPVYPAAVVELAAAAVQADPAIANRLLDLRPGRVFEITDAEAVYQFGPAALICAGYTERLLPPALHRFDLIGEPANPYTVLELEHDERGRLDTAYSSLENAVDSTQTTFTVQATDDGCLWTEDDAQFPFDINVGGERMTVTDITTLTPSFVSVGTAAHADNATVAPGAPAGAQAGDLLLVLGATRDLASHPTISDNDYTPLLDVVSLILWGRIWDGVEAMPTVGTSGGSAGSTVTGQIACFRNVTLAARDTAVFGNGSAQDMLLPEIYKFMSKSLLITAAQKQDDWTSVATLAGATEIAEPSTTTGSDQGVVWDYQAFTGVVSAPQQNFTVTGGAAANSRTGRLVVGNWQTFTVTRSVNGVVKPHAAGTPVHLYEEPRYSL